MVCVVCVRVPSFSLTMLHSVPPLSFILEESILVQIRPYSCISHSQAQGERAGGGERGGAKAEGRGRGRGIEIQKGRVEKERKRQNTSSPRGGAVK